MDALAALEATPFAAWARTSRWGYAGLNTAHVLGVALLVGAILPLNAVRLGAPLGDRLAAARLLVPFAGAGLGLAVLTGALLATPRATEYAALGVFRAKLALIAFGAAAALALHARFGVFMERAPPGRQALHAAHSVATWLGVLALGRLIAFAG